MVSISATELFPSSQAAFFPKRYSSRRLLFQSQSPERNLSCAIDFNDRALCFATNVRPLTAVLSSSSGTRETDTKEAALTIREICQGHVPEHVLRRMEEVGYVVPTDVQREALPTLFSGRDCILHAQTGSGKTLTYLLLIFSVINPQRSAVQALIVVPTRELGMQVTKVARMLAAKPMELQVEQKSCIVMALLDGGMLRRHKSWLKTFRQSHLL